MIGCGSAETIRAYLQKIPTNYFKLSSPTNGPGSHSNSGAGYNTADTDADINGDDKPDRIQIRLPNNDQCGEFDFASYYLVNDQKGIKFPTCHTTNCGGTYYISANNGEVKLEAKIGPDGTGDFELTFSDGTTVAGKITGVRDDWV